MAIIHWFQHAPHFSSRKKVRGVQKFVSQTSNGRQLNLEQLESRHLLTIFTVTNLDDLPVSAANDAPGTLRQAIFDANAEVGMDSLDFQTGLSGVLSLSEGELEITESIEINGPGQAFATIDAGNNSRIFNFTDFSGDLVIRDLTLAHGRTIGDNASNADSRFSGGAIRSLSSGSVSLFSSTISESSTAGNWADGGAISAVGDVVLNFSTISGNSTAKFQARGGGVRALGDVTVNSSTVTNNRTNFYAADGGGIFSYANVTVTNSTISGNSTNRMSADGGGIVARMDVTIDSSTISGNSAWDDGGGVFSYRDVFVVDSTITNNSTVDIDTGGGGIGATQHVTVDSSTISNNSASDAGGGAIFAKFHVTIVASTISGNSANSSGVSEHGLRAEGGGIRSERHVTIIDSTISGNSTSGEFARGGGVAAGRNVTIFHSTVTNNSTTGSSADGGGIAATGDWIDQGEPTTSELEIEHSIIAGNTSGGASPDLLSNNDAVSITYSLIGDNSDTPFAESQVPDENGNLIGSVSGAGLIDPRLDGLADNGGPTFTHALLVGSLAINSGNVSVDSPPSEDQRGLGYPRIAFGRIDLGAFELQKTADFDLDGDVDGGDFLAWQRGYSTTGGALLSDGDADGNQTVEDQDLVIWEEMFGQGALSALAAPIAGEADVTEIAPISIATPFFDSEPHQISKDPTADADRLVTAQLVGHRTRFRTPVTGFRLFMPVVDTADFLEEERFVISSFESAANSSYSDYLAARDAVRLTSPDARAPDLYGIALEPATRSRVEEVAHSLDLVFSSWGQQTI